MSDVAYDFGQALQQKLTDRQRKKVANPNVETIYSRRQIEQAFLETFELTGGIPRLSIWANDPENYGTFLQLLMKMAPKEAQQVAGTVLEYRSNVPSSPLSVPKMASTENATAANWVKEPAEDV